ncbi:MAG: TIGR00266 family protein [Planctomycetota bacterium]|nr:TIGR00266 family protein [Planctomycetota bacterium]
MFDTPDQPDQKGDFEFEITERPDYAMVTVQLRREGQQVFAEPSAMVTMSPTIQLKAGFKGGLRGTIGRALGGESVIINTFTAKDGPGEVSLAPGAAGDVVHRHLDGETIYIQRGGYLAHTEGIDLTGKWQGAKGFFSGQGLILLKASGVGDVFFNSYGAILEIDVYEDYIVDTGYIVAFEETLQYHVSILRGLRGGGTLKSLFFGGEGLICRFSGHGKVWVQTRYVTPFLRWVHPYRPTKKRD